LPSVQKQVSTGRKLVFEAHDKDPIGSDMLGSTSPLSLLTIVENEEIKEHNLDLYDKDKKKVGLLVLTTQLECVEPDEPANANMNRKCSLKVRIRDASFK